MEGSRLAAWTTTGWRSNPKRRDTPRSLWKHTHTHTCVICTVPPAWLSLCLSYTHAQIMSSNTAERLGVYGYLMKHPHSQPPPNLLTSMGVQWRRKRKVGHVCRFNEAKKRCMTSLCFLLQQSYSLQKTDSILIQPQNPALLKPSQTISFQLLNMFFVFFFVDTYAQDRGQRNESHLLHVTAITFDRF